MGQMVIYGLGGYCAECDSSHDHPLNNIISVEELSDTGIIEVEEISEPSEIEVVAQALSQLSPEALSALKQALNL